MSMLAERKRKTKWVVNPTKKPLWTQDSSGIKFGKELMEKMGWSAGKGLGLKEQGIEEPLRVSYKNDTKGMGFKGHDEDWIEHQDEFNMLLSQLSSNNGTGVMEESEIEKPKVKSLELKSKHSRVRVHYQKFTRGKDLSNYSEKDLVCILGLNKAKEEKSKPEAVIRTESKSEYETSFGVTTINSGSIEDYFKKKYSGDKFKSNNLFRNVEATENISESFTDGQSVIPVCEESKEPWGEEKKHKKRKHKSEADTASYETVEDKSERQKYKKKKALMSKEETEMLEDKITYETTENGSEEQKSKKKKTSKSKEEAEKSEADCMPYETIENSGEEQKSKKRKTSKPKGEPSEIENQEENNFSYETVENGSEEQKSKRRKTSKPKEEALNTEKLEADNIIYETTVNENEEKKSKQKKTSKSKREPPKTDETEKCEITESEKSKEKSNKNKTETNSEEAKIKKKRKNHDKNDGTSENNRQTVENIERSDHSPDDESFLAILKEQNTKSKKVKKKSKHERHKSMLETEKVTSTEGTVENEESRFLEEKKSKKRKHKSNPEIEVDNVDNSNPPIENDEQGNRELVEILEKKYKIKRIEQEGVETKNDSVAGVVDVSENSSKAVTAGAEGRKEVVSGKGPVSEPFQNKFTSEKVLDLIRWADIKEFRGSNLKTVLGYGLKKEILRNKLG